jgi:hypothetical protein
MFPTRVSALDGAGFGTPNPMPTAILIEELDTGGL